NRSKGRQNTVACYNRLNCGNHNNGFRYKNSVFKIKNQGKIIMGGNFKFSGGAEEINTEGIQNQDSVFLSAEETKPLQAGSKVPAVELNTINGEIFNLREEIAKNPSILIFYRGGWCPYCNMQLGQLKGIEETLIGMGYRILAISVDKPEKLRETLDKYEMKYRLL